MVEFVSANPTGPMHMGNARGGVLGDTLANVLERAGYDTWKEFYVNDAGNQIHKFAVSIDARYLQFVLGEENVPFPEDGYHGDDIKELARAIYDQHGDSWKDQPEEERQEAMAQFGLSVNIPKMKEDLLRTSIEYDEWFLESSLHDSGYVAETVELLAGKGWTYEKDGALWLNTTDLLKQKYLRRGQDPGAGGQAGPEGRRAPPGQRLLHLLCRRHRLPPQQAGEAGLLTRPSTSGAPTTTATWPGSRPPWTAWVWTAPTGW